MNILKIESNPFSVNTYIVFNNKKDAIIIDAGCMTKEEQKKFTETISKHSLNPKFILLTHAHLDHIFGCAFIQNYYNIDVLMHEDSNPFLQSANEHAQRFGMEIKEIPEKIKYIDHLDKVEIEDISFQVLLTPGHADGSLCFYSKDNDLVFTGDVLFSQSIGRTDLPTGNYELLIENIKKHLMVLPPKTIVYPGHGPSTTIEDEIKNNPFIN